MTRYIGLDAHSSTCTFAVIGESGKRLKHETVETNGKVLVDFVKTVPPTRYLCVEEGTQSQWLYDLLSPHVEEMIVVRQQKIVGNKDDIRDAYKLAEDMRIGAVKPIFKELGQYKRLKSLTSTYTMLREDTVRIQNRIKAIYRSCGTSTSEQNVYASGHRQQWLEKVVQEQRESSEILYAQYDAVSELKLRAREHLLEELNHHAISKVLKTCCGMGEIRVAQVMSVVVTPYRFRTKRQLWSYSGLGVIMRSSADWEMTANGWRHTQKVKTRGLNHNFNRTLKEVFKGAATTVITKRQKPLYDDYVWMLEQGTKPPLAKLTIARKIAATVLSMWKNQEAYDPQRDRNKN
jgi:transposase